MVKRRAANLDVANLFRDLSRRLGGELEDECYGQEENVGFLLDLVKRTVEKGESNSLLILGPHGSGKTALGKKISILILNTPCTNKYKLEEYKRIFYSFVDIIYSGHQFQSSVKNRKVYFFCPITSKKIVHFCCLCFIKFNVLEVCK